MAKKKENSEQDEIKHIVRIANTDLEGKKSVQYSLTGIKGINRRIARIISDRSNVDPSATIGYLDDEKIDSVKAGIWYTLRRHSHNPQEAHMIPDQL